MNERAEPSSLQWPIPSTLVAKLGVLVYTERLSDEQIASFSLCEELIANTRKRPNALSDPTVVYFSGGTYCIEIDGQVIDRGEFLAIEDFELGSRLDRFKEGVVAAGEFTSSFLEKERSGRSQLFKKVFDFHQVIPPNGSDLVKMYDWDVSNLSQMISNIRRPYSTLASRSGIAVTAVPIFRYPTFSEERMSERMIAMARIHPNYGPEVVLNGLLLNAIEEVVLEIVGNSKVSPLSKELFSDHLFFRKRKENSNGDVASEANDLFAKFENPNFIREIQDRNGIADSVSVIPLSNEGLRMVGFLRDMSLMFCLYHEEAHIGLAHLSYLNDCETVQSKARLIPGRIAGDVKNHVVEGVSDKEMKQMLRDCVFNDDVSQIMELEADHQALRNTYVLFDGLKDEGVSVKHFMMILFSVTVVISYTEEFHTKSSGNTHPDVSVRFFSLVLHFCNLFVKNEEILSPFDPNGLCGWKDLNSDVKAVGPEEIVHHIKFARSWMMAFSQEFGLNMAIEDFDHLVSDVVLLLSGDHSLEQQIRLVRSSCARSYCQICLKKKSGIYRGMAGSKFKFRMTQFATETINQHCIDSGRWDLIEDRWLL